MRRAVGLWVVIAVALAMGSLARAQTREQLACVAQCRPDWDAAEHACPSRPERERERCLAPARERARACILACIQPDTGGLRRNGR